jgi:hypothetical protein
MVPDQFIKLGGSDASKPPWAHVREPAAPDHVPYLSRGNLQHYGSLVHREPCRGGGCMAMLLGPPPRVGALAFCSHGSTVARVGSDRQPSPSVGAVTAPQPTRRQWAGCVVAPGLSGVWSGTMEALKSSGVEVAPAPGGRHEASTSTLRGQVRPSVPVPERRVFRIAPAAGSRWWGPSCSPVGRPG